MKIRTLTIAALSVSAMGLSGCSSMWSAVGGFSDYMAEKTSWISFAGLRGPQNVEELAVVTPENVDEGVVEMASLDGDYVASGDVVMFDMVETQPEIQPLPAMPAIDEYGFFTPESAVSYDSEGNMVVDTSPIPCPEGTYLNAENSCMMLD